MSLVNCLECGKEISDLADACIHCGCPIIASKSKCIIKAASEYGMVDAVGKIELSIFDSSGEEIMIMKTGSTVSIPIKEEIELYAQFKRERISGEEYKMFSDSIILSSTSNRMKILPGRITRLKIMYRQDTIFSALKLQISEEKE